ncbi:E3 ubiquitin-protein ligase TTC3-like isoform X2 [Mya arenaria]|uniref:E3 ubiquitin-protein ligase TTC3-like isoform X2 n=1 Tax=Mya arenaria TaxID=6604 RepID=UPI0022E55668|nr:E3 ubiquitin-protein ligase TTC3-like isoform X2 [Mya arenaria]
MSDSDEPPALVESSDDEQNKDSLSIVDKWLKKDEKTLKLQEQWMRIFCFAPFLFGCNNVVPAAWVRPLINVKLILNESRQYEITYFEWQEWECLDLLDFAVSETQKALRNKSKLRHVLECTEKLEECRTGVIIDENLAIEEAEKSEEIADIWRCVLQNENATGREKAAKFAVLYILKIYREHVVYLCEKNSDFIEHTKKSVKNKDAAKTANEYKRLGNEFFNNNEFVKSSELYSLACKQDPFHHVYYGNRALAYTKMKAYKDALADARRAVTIKPDFPKGHHRYALAFYELGQLDAAIKVNERGMSLCSKSQDYTNFQQLKEQGEKFVSEQGQRNNGLTPIPKDLDEKLATVPINNPGVDLTEKMGCKPPVIDSHDDDVPMMVSSESEESDSDESTSSSNQLSNKKSKQEKQTSKQEKQTSKQRKASRKDKQEAHNVVDPHPEQATPVEAPPKLSPEEEQRRRREEEKAEFQALLRAGSELYGNEAYKNAQSSYGKALDMLAHHENVEELFGVDELDLITLKYACGMAGINTGVARTMWDGMEIILEIQTKHRDVRFPAAYLAMAKANVTLHRFPQALNDCESGLKIATHVRYAQVAWPGTTTLIKETTPSVLKGAFEEIIEVCKFPPPPDGTCRYHKDPFDDRTSIYMDDPDFRGYVKMICQNDCVVTFHQVCWKAYKDSLNKHNEKDILDTECPTPDCTGYIMQIHITRPDSLEKHYISERLTASKDQKHKKMSGKQKTTNENKIAKKQEKKEKRKKKRRDNEDNIKQEDEQEALIVDGASACAFIEDMETSDQPLPDMKLTKRLMKENIDVKAINASSGKTKKSKKKKDKSKQILNVEVNFTDNKEETLRTEMSAALNEEEQEKGQKDAPQNPFSVPTQLQTEINKFEKSYTAPVKPMFKPDEVTENLFSYFAEILQNGPLAADDAKIQDELEVFPFEATEKIKLAGGLPDFLKQSLKFAVIDDVISLMQHAKSAREIALQRRKEKEASGIDPVVADWKTVGKSVNNTDGLIESVTSSVNYSAKVSSTSSVIPTGSKMTGNKISALSSVSSLENTSYNSLTDFEPPVNSKPVHWSLGLNAFEGKISSDSYGTRQSGSGHMDAIDSIDDFPVEKTVLSKPSSNSYDDLDDIDELSDAYSDNRESQESSGVSKSGFKADTRFAYDYGNKLDPNISRSSSKSDISERSERSGALSEVPKPLKPLNNSFLTVKKPAGIWESQDNSQDLWKVSGNEENEFGESERQESLAQEMQRVGEEFVRRTDMKLVEELADSVVEKLFEGITVSKVERLEMLKRVSTDIMKDFEKSEKSRKQGSRGLWANTPAGDDYSKQFAADYMKKYYEVDGSLTSPTSNVNVVYPQRSTVDNASCFKTNSGFNSMLHIPVSDHSNPEPVSSIALPESSSGYNLFSGPSWGLNSFSSQPQLQPQPQPIKPPPIISPPTALPFVRPPMSATAYYAAPPPPLRMSFRHPVPPFPPNMRLPGPGSFIPPQLTMIPTEKKDKETQCVSQLMHQATMTDVYEPFKNEYITVKDERDRAIKLIQDGQQAYEKMAREYTYKENQLVVLGAEVKNKESLFELEKKSWKSEQENLQKEIQILKDIVASKEKSELDLREKMAKQERKVDDLAFLAKGQRDKDLSEMKKLIENADLYRQQVELQQDRAKSSELQILKSKLKSACGVLERSQKEAIFHLQRLSAFKQKLEEEPKSVPPALQQALDFWANVKTQSEDNLVKIKGEYDVQMEEVQRGRQLSELTSIRVRSPPPVPESLKAMPFMQPGFMMPRMPMSNRQPIGQSVGALPASTMNAILGPVSSTQTPMYNISQPSQNSAPQPVPIRPLQPSTVAIRLLSGPRPSLTQPPRAPLRPLGVKGLPGQMSSFEKLVYKLQSVFPEKSRPELSALIQELRQSRGGSLSGLTMEDILTQITGMVRSKDRQILPLQKGPTPPPGLSNKWAFPSNGAAALMGRPANSSSGAELHRITTNGGLGSELFKEEEDPCVICHEEMDLKQVVTLQCGHIFHDECIRKWFQEQSTCPNCRVHALLTDEFPSLG